MPSNQLTILARTISYSYDDLYRLTAASYINGEVYTYTYDPVSNRLQQIINTLAGTGGTPPPPSTTQPIA